MTLDKIDKFNGTMLLDELEAELKELENELSLFLDNAIDSTSIHEEVPLFFLILEDLEHIQLRIKKARKQMKETNKKGKSA